MHMLVPPLPPPEGWHPLIVHFPIALLMIAPILVIVGLFGKKCIMAWWGAASILLIVGSICAWIATYTGGLSVKADLVAAAMAMNPDASKAIQETLREHAELAEATRNIFTMVSLMFGAFVGFIMVTKRELNRAATAGITVAFLVLWGFGAYKLTETGHLGATLVHKYQVTVPVEPSYPNSK